ncbi:hypothetical protein AVEN_255182-1 [Araneus ventricosus]|uniref:Uncharacterized protein n=1 Tax=Araneus ventricosus TaxID=182803 RepID=A0A4Y2BB78_ARAVE|nr:hypothetical protein AVEN_255182-1 [Araneus ventricosus]
MVGKTARLQYSIPGGTSGLETRNRPCNCRVKKTRFFSSPFFSPEKGYRKKVWSLFFSGLLSAGLIDPLALSALKKTSRTFSEAEIHGPALTNGMSWGSWFCGSWVARGRRDLAGK